jgi:DNA (cytosine-5)-methyltransferase 1
MDAEVRQPSFAERMGKACKRLDALMTSMSTARLEMGRVLLELGSVEISRKEFRAYMASEFGWAQADVNSALRLGDAAADLAALKTGPGVGFALIESLVSATEEARIASVRALHAGQRITATTVRKASREMSLAAKPELERQRTVRDGAIRRAASEDARFRLKMFNTDFKELGEALVAFYLSPAADDAKAGQLLAGIRADGMRCIHVFRQIVNPDTLPPRSELDLDIHQSDQVQLARAWWALERVAAGDFQTVDPETFNPIDRRHPYIDHDIVEALSWLFNIPFLTVLKSPAVFSISETQPLLTAPERTFTSLEVCAGAGGMAIGLHGAGFRAASLFEKLPGAVATLRDSENCNEWDVHEADIRSVDFSKYRGHIDLVAGGVPCQPHSSLGKGEGENDERDLFREAVRIVDEVRPRAFFFENVKGFGFTKSSAYRARLHALFGDLGYDSLLFSWRGDDYGLAQERPRVALVGFRDGLMSRFRVPKPASEIKNTVGNAIYDIVANNGWPHAAEWRDGIGAKMGSTITGGSERSGRDSFGSNFRKDAWLATGIDIQGLAENSPDEDHPADKPFLFTLPMGARLQGFPDYWRFRSPSDALAGDNRPEWWHLGNGHRAKRQQIGNALPPVMAAAVGLAIHEALADVRFDYPQALANRQLPPRGVKKKHFKDLMPKPWDQFMTAAE